MANSKSKTAKRIGQAIMIIGVIVIPLLYSFFYLEAFWDPYARLNDVPVAIVNMDEGATINGKERNIGNEVCDNLLEDGTLKFVTTTDEDAKDGVLNQKYYASITVPKDFSKSVASASSDSEKLHSKIIYSGNQKKNYLATQIIENALPRIQQKVNSSIDAEIISTLSEQISGVPDQMGELQDGLGKLHNGSVDLKDGTSQLKTGSNTLADGGKKLNTGVNKVADGSKTLSNGMSVLRDGTDSLNLKVPTLANGVKTLDDGAGQLLTGAKALENGVSTYTAGVTLANDGVGTLKEGVGAYTAGVSQADAGATALKNGINQYTSGVTTAKSGATNLYNGVKTASTGLNQIVSQVEGSVTELNNSASQEKLDALTGGAQSLKNGTATFKSYYKQAMQYLSVYQATGDTNALNGAILILNNIDSSVDDLASGAASLESGVNTLAGGMTQVKTNTNMLLGGLKQLQSGFGVESNQTTLLGGAYALQAGLAQIASNNSTLTDGAESLETGLNTIVSNNDSLNDGVATLQTGLNTLVSNNEALNGGASQLTDGASQISGGLTELNSNIPALKGGVSSLADGANQLYAGSRTLSSGSAELAIGSKQLYNGILTLKTGATKLDNGAGQLKNGLNTAKTGVDDSVKTTVEKLGALDGLADYAKEPVSTEIVNVEPVENYGSAFAPYFMCLSLWVGGLMIFFGIYLDYNKKIKSLTKEGKYFRNKIVAFSLIGLAQGVALAMVIKFALGITVNNFAFLLLSCAVVSMCFMSIIQFLIMALGNAGKFLSLFLLILQLTSCAGTFPVETQSGFFQLINKLLPMTYATQLFKEAISGTVGSWAMKNLWIIVAFWVGAVALGVVGRIINKKKIANTNAVAA